MNLKPLSKFKKYKSDWSYPVQVQSQHQIVSDTQCPNFQSVMKDVIIIGQCFALNPVLGVCEKDANKLRFKFFSWRCLYTILSMLGQLAMVCSIVFNLNKTSFSSVYSAAAVLFYCLGFITTLVFLRIAIKWPRLCKQIATMEVDDPIIDAKLKMKFNVACFLVLTLAILEHVFAELHGMSIALDCEPNVNIYESHSRRSLPWVYLTIPYSNYVAFVVHFINIQCTFNWNFTDLFVICMSLYLTSRLEQVNQRVTAAKNKDCPVERMEVIDDIEYSGISENVNYTNIVAASTSSDIENKTTYENILPSTSAKDLLKEKDNSSPSFWRTLREDYNRATHLVRQVDSVISGVIFISFTNNLFFVCSQLLHILSEGISIRSRCTSNEDAADKRFMYGYEHTVYFVYSFIFLVARSLAVSLIASEVHSASLEPAYALYNVSSTTYCVEIERFLEQIHGSTVALTGLQFFSVKRGLILTIAATIVTYELVLMQFNGVAPTSSTLR